MIKTSTQYQLTKKHLEEFRVALQALQASASVDPDLKDLQLNAFQSMVEDLQGQLDEYDRLQSGGLKEIRIKSLQDLPKLLIQLRIAKGWTQKQLGKALGLKEQQIQRYESNEYGGASLSRVFEVLDALGAPVDLKSVRLPSGFMTQTDAATGRSKRA